MELNPNSFSNDTTASLPTALTVRARNLADVWSLDHNFHLDEAKGWGFETKFRCTHHTSSSSDVVKLCGYKRVQEGRITYEPAWVKSLLEMRTTFGNTSQFWNNVVEAFGLRIVHVRYKHDAAQIGVPLAFAESTWHCQPRKKSSRLKYVLPYLRMGRPFGGVNKIETDRLMQECKSFASLRRLYAKDSAIGVGPYTLKSGDSVWLLEGESTATILSEKIETDYTTEESTEEWSVTM